VEEALVRELKEEFCVEPKSIEFLNYIDVLRNQDGKETHWLGLDFKIEVDRELVKIGEPDKMEQVRWCSMKDRPTPMLITVENSIIKNIDKL